MTEREPEEQEGPIIRDRRRLDPETGAVREPAAPAGASVDDGAPAPPGTTDGAGAL